MKEIDSDGFALEPGDHIAFGFGIPPQRVVGCLFEKDGKIHFRALTPRDVTPKQVSLKKLRGLVGDFWKISHKRKEARDDRNAG